MKSENTRKWYHKKRYAIPLGFVGLITAFGIYGNNPVRTEVKPITSTAVQQKTSEDISAPTTQQVKGHASGVGQNIEPNQTPSPKPSALPAPNGTYKNVDGNNIPSPYKAPSVPAGASAQCRDGTYSFSANRKGTCSHHGGVAKWH